MSDKSSWWARLNTALFPYLGPPPLGPGPGGERVDAAPPVARCPLCSAPMADHAIERTADWSTPTRIHCPPQAA